MPAATDKTPLPDPWRRYDLAQRHYETDLGLFSSRMNLFLLVQTGLLTLSNTVSTGQMSFFDAHPKETTSFAVALCVVWLLVGWSAVSWIWYWRFMVRVLGLQLPDGEASAEGLPSTIGAGFTPEKRNLLIADPRYEKPIWLMQVAWKLRPTTITCMLPLLFIVAWLGLYSIHPGSDAGAAARQAGCAMRVAAVAKRALQTADAKLPVLSRLSEVVMLGVPKTGPRATSLSRELRASERAIAVAASELNGALVTKCAA
ncbi:MAG TPA: hypothetical protein VFR48_04460 [Solirubrobacteraceae bacterium]|nr:hypothetical protein [Solirubrobacteraceae bacterium]